MQVLLAYTSSGKWRGDAAVLPLGVIEFDAATAWVLNQRAFHLDLRCMAQVPVTAAWFPNLDEPERGVVAVAGARLRSRIERELAMLVARSRELIEMRGPG